MQVYFLRYDTEEQLYTLKDYAELFCRHAEETLLANFNPTQIEIICNNLRHKLELCGDEKQVDDWITTFFYAFKPIIKNQVDRLGRQIDHSVQEIRATTQLQNASIIDINTQYKFKHSGSVQKNRIEHGWSWNIDQELHETEW